MSLWPSEHKLGLLISASYKGTPRVFDTLSAVLYINLAERTDRKARILENLSAAGIDDARVQRVDAVKHNLGAIGCAKSHIKALEHVLASGYDNTLILEDDFVWDVSPEVVNRVLSAVLFDKEWSVCLLACNGACEILSDYKQRVIKCMTTSAYIIRKHYVPKLLGLWKDMLPSLEANALPTTGSKFAIDITWQRLQAASLTDWVATNPYLGKHQLLRHR